LYLGRSKKRGKEIYSAKGGEKNDGKCDPDGIPTERTGTNAFLGSWERGGWDFRILRTGNQKKKIKSRGDNYRSESESFGGEKADVGCQGHVLLRAQVRSAGRGGKDMERSRTKKVLGGGEKRGQKEEGREEFFYKGNVGLVGQEGRPAGAKSKKPKRKKRKTFQSRGQHGEVQTPLDVRHRVRRGPVPWRRRT